MHKLTIRNKSNPQFNAFSAVKHADFFGKFKGLMLKKQFGVSDSIVLDQGSESRLGSAIHMLFMYFDIGVFWVDSDCIVVDKILARPWKLAYTPKKPARFVIETDPKYLQEIELGDELEFIYD